MVELNTTSRNDKGQFKERQKKNVNSEQQIEILELKEWKHKNG